LTLELVVPKVQIRSGEPFKAYYFLTNDTHNQISVYLPGLKGQLLFIYPPDPVTGTRRQGAPMCFVSREPLGDNSDYFFLGQGEIVGRKVVIEDLPVGEFKVIVGYQKSEVAPQRTIYIESGLRVIK
jgi:hypothetical protein